MSTDLAQSDDKPVRKQQQRSVVTQQKLLDAAIEAFSERASKAPRPAISQSAPACITR
jgi:hypothetical protein